MDRKRAPGTTQWHLSYPSGESMRAASCQTSSRTTVATRERWTTSLSARGVVIGKGGFGLVTKVVERSTGHEYACKSINKRLNVPNIAPAKVEQHLANIDREVRVLKLLRGDPLGRDAEGCVGG